MGKQIEATVIEDNGGGLSLFVFDENGIEGGKVIWSHYGYEYAPGNLTTDIDNLIETNSIDGWDGGDENPQSVWDQLDNYKHGWEIVAQVHDGKLHKFPGKMGTAARLEFGIEDD